MAEPRSWRKTAQELASARRAPLPPDRYNIYPAFPIPAGQVHLGWSALARVLADAGQVIIDGYGGVFWQQLRADLSAALAELGVRTNWVAVDAALQPPEAVDCLVTPFLRGDDPLFGYRYPGDLADFFSRQKLAGLRADPNAKLNILYGCGAALAGWPGLLVYVDLPKNEIQFRSRAGSIANLGAAGPADPKLMYKRFYFVDWVALNRHKATLLPRIDWLVDAQRPALPTFMAGGDFRSALATMGHNYFRVRPWFEPGAWGGQWIKDRVPGVATEVPNYAWSFELIVPENGLLVESAGLLLEFAFDWLMLYDPVAVLGDGAAVFGYEFPIRFDYLDTMDGGNLSLQVHPRPDYIRAQFGENYTQDETYYILDCQPGARVYLGFQEDIDPAEFRAALERSVADGTPVPVERFVETHPAHQGDLFLIPHGTIHCSGAGNLVLEISATPYIFTLKMYDWLRLDLDGQPRPLNIDRAFANLNFERRGARVREELLTKPGLLASGADWHLWHLPTHLDHFYDVHRYEFKSALEVKTAGSCHVLNLVSGEGVLLETDGGLRQRFNHAETFVVPAAAGRYRLVNIGRTTAQVVKAFLKPVPDPSRPRP